MRVALIHDWLYTKGGAEKVLEAFIEIFPNADLFTLVCHLPENERGFLKNVKINTSFLQNIPLSKKYFKHFLPLFPMAIESFDLRDYDLVISSSYAVAKGVLSTPEQIHISYCHSPIRYAWDMYHTYIKEHNIKGVKGAFIKYTLHKIRIWDVISSNRVDYFIANSNFVKKRISKFYKRDSTVINPFADTEKFKFFAKKEDFYLTASRLVPYKKVKLIVKAFNKNKKKLIVIGEGEELKEIKKIAKKNVEVLGYREDRELIYYMQRAKAFVYAALEDFGIVPIEALSCGTPVICYARGGVLDSVKNKINGIFFYDQSIEAINRAIEDFEKSEFDYEKISKDAQKFSKENFKKEIKNFIEEKTNVRL